ncbi:MAG: hypothetical protein SNJ53_05190, partial [Thermodesulfovibrionales bacterium]
AQKKAEERLNRLEDIVKDLIEAQKKTEKRLEELAEAQRRTEESLNKLIKRVDNIEVQLGGLSAAIGYGLEDRMFPHIAKYAKKVYRLEPEEISLRRHLIYDDGKYDELNIFVKGKIGGKPALLLGECKAQPGKRDIDRFMKVIERVAKYYDLQVYPFIIGYTFDPSIVEYIKKTYSSLRYHMTYEVEYGQY